MSQRFLTSEKVKRSTIYERIKSYREDIRKHMPCEYNDDFRRIGDLVKRTANLIGANFGIGFSVFVSQIIREADDDALPRLVKSVDFAFLQIGDLNLTSTEVSFGDLVDTLTFNLSANDLDAVVFYGIVNAYFLDFFRREGDLVLVDEGVTNERSDPVSDKSKLDKSRLSPVFEGQLNREALAKALNLVMAIEGLSERDIEEKFDDVSKTDVSRARNGKASMDKTADILSKLGYPPFLTIPK